MTYKKPLGVRYVDMAMWIDENAYSENCKDDKLFEYLYLLCEMFARKHNFFRKADYYDEFSLHCATYLFNRLKNKKQFVFDENGNPQMQKIKSITNYIRSTIYARKVDFEQLNFNQTYKSYEDCDAHDVDRDRILLAYKSYHDYNGCEFSMCLETLPKCVYETCKRTPYFGRKDIFNDLYASVLLTIINQITLSAEDMQKVQKMTSGVYEFYTARMCEYSDPLKSVIAYGRCKDLKNYILFLANRSKKTLARDLSAIIHSWEPSDAVIDSLILNQIEECTGVAIYGDQE